MLYFWIAAGLCYCSFWLCLFCISGNKSENKLKLPALHYPASWRQDAFVQCSRARFSGCLQVPSACGLGSFLEKTSDHLICMPSVVRLHHGRNGTICAHRVCITEVWCWSNLVREASRSLTQAQTPGSGRGLASDPNIYIYIQMDFEEWLIWACCVVHSWLQWLHSLHLLYLWLWHCEVPVWDHKIWNQPEFLCIFALSGTE